MSEFAVVVVLAVSSLLVVLAKLCLVVVNRLAWDVALERFEALHQFRVVLLVLVGV
jgi:hypothetical protein